MQKYFRVNYSIKNIGERITIQNNELRGRKYLKT